MKMFRLLCRVSLFLLVCSVLLIGPADAASRQGTSAKRKPAASKAATKQPAKRTAAAKEAGPQRSAAPGKKPAARGSSTAGAKSTATQRATAAKLRMSATPAQREFALSSSGFQPARNLLASDPVLSQLHGVSKTYLDGPTSSREQELRRFAAGHPNHEAGALAYLALGYTALEGKRFAAAEEYLAAGRRIKSPLPDYFDYFLAEALRDGGRHKDALAFLEGFEERYPQSSLVGRAVVARASSWTATGRATDAATLLKSRLDALRRPDADMALGRAYAVQGLYPQAVEAYRQVYYLYPNSSEADDAEREIRKLSGQAAVPPAPIEMRKERAERLAQARQWSAAGAAYQDIAANTSGAERERARVQTAEAAYHMSRTDRAYSLLRSLQFSDPEAEAERLYWQSQCERRMSRDADFLRSVRQIGERTPNSPWYEEALLSAGNYYLLQRDFEQSSGYYRTLYEHFPNGKYSAMAHWRVAWKSYRASDSETARRQFQEHILRYPQSPQLSAALYWLGRIAEDAGNKAVALAYFRKLNEAFPQYFYGITARPKLSAAQVTPVFGETLPPDVERVLGVVQLSKPPLAGVAPPADLPAHRKKVEALEAADLVDLALVELRHATDDPSHGKFLTLEVARLEHDRGRFATATEYIRRVYPNYFAYSFDDLDRQTWQLLFPMPWWSAIQANALRNGVDPYLVAALIRQESAFDPFAISGANAYGLMQLLPVTGRRMSGVTSKNQRFNNHSLLDPIRNIELGTKYLREMIDRYGGRLEPALASYNAGPERVDAWLQLDKNREPAEFVENIPFTETREYVQALTRNVAIYRRLYSGYGARPSSAAGGADPERRSSRQ